MIAFRCVEKTKGVSIDNVAIVRRCAAENVAMLVNFAMPHSIHAVHHVATAFRFAKVFVVFPVNIATKRMGVYSRVAKNKRVVITTRRCR